MTNTDTSDTFISEYATAPRAKSGTKSWLMLCVFVVGALTAGSVGSLFTGAELDGWYREIAKPAFTPPDWVFPIAWTYLFVTMGIAAWLVWRAPFTGPEKTFALRAYWAHFIVNVGWSAAFFWLTSPALGSVVAAVLFGAVTWVALLFARIRPLAGVLFVPYALWVAFATLLTVTIWFMNA
ncbi:MAG: TspO/MBR family protein [Pseudomonadota bacterium]